MTDILTPHLQRYFDKGYESQHAGLYDAGSVSIFTEMHGSGPNDDPKDRTAWYAFCEGGNKASAEIAARKRIEYKVDEFLVRIKALCAEYGAEITSGCGCCGAGLYVKDYETSIHIGREVPDTE